MPIKWLKPLNKSPIHRTKNAHCVRDCSVKPFGNQKLGTESPPERPKYDASGNRVMKVAFHKTGMPDITYTHYVRDASGNVMAIYTVEEQLNETSGVEDKMTVKEYNIYGSSRLGVRNSGQVLVSSTQPLAGTNSFGERIKANNALTITTFDPTYATRMLGNKNYELANHLGNVLATVSDMRIPVVDGANNITGYVADVTSANDYYPFGSTMPGRIFDNGSYRYGFNGMEKDDEIKGSGNSYDFGARMYDPRLGRMLSLDKQRNKFPAISPYSYAANSPLILIDVEGDWIARFKNNSDPSKGIVFEAEEGDDLVTLEVQLGLPKGYLSTDGSYFENAQFEIVEGSWLTLDKLEVVQRINDYLANEKIDETNCANAASAINGKEQSNAWSENSKSDGTADLFKELQDNYEEVLPSKATIGDIIHYGMSKEYFEREIREYYLYRVGWNENQLEEYILTDGYKQELQKVMSETNGAHYAVVLLKSKDGEEIMQIIQKSGKSPVNIANYTENEGQTPNEDWTPAIILFEAKPVSEGGDSSINQKKGENDNVKINQ